MIQHPCNYERYKNNIKPDNFIEYSKLLDITQPPDFKNDSIKEVVDKMTLYIAVRFPLRLSLYDLTIIKNLNNV